MTASRQGYLVKKFNQVEMSLVNMPEGKSKVYLEATHKATLKHSLIKMIRKRPTQPSDKKGSHLNLLKQSMIDSVRTQTKVSSEEVVMQAHSEINFYKMIVHPNIVRMIDFFENKDFIYICFEHYRGSDLKEYCLQQRQKHGSDFDEYDIKDIMIKVAEAIDFLHDLGIILRNFSLKSVIMTENQSDTNSQSYPRICKLDQAQIMHDTRLTSGQYGETKYNAPEVVRGKPYDMKADSWSFGVVLFYMVTGKFPFTGSENKTPKSNSRPIQSLDFSSLGLKPQGSVTSQQPLSKLEQAIVKSNFRREQGETLMGFGGKELTGTLRDLLCRLLDVNPLRRLTMRTALKHAWFKEKRPPKKGLQHRSGMHSSSHSNYRDDFSVSPSPPKKLKR